MKRRLRSFANWTRLLLTSPGRRMRIQEWCARRMAPLSVSFYHRVADVHPNDWTISRDGFRQHIEHCRRYFDVVSLHELQRRVVLRDSPRPAIAVTFDDGYRENCEFAIPLMIEHAVPCLYFVAVDHVVKQKPFSHDESVGQPLAVNSVQQLRDMSDYGIEIGLHTRNHVDFARVHDRGTIQSEIIDAKDELEQLIGKPVRYFAFPYGMLDQLTQAAIEAVHEAGLVGFCSAYGGYNYPGGDAFHIRRFHADPDFTRFRAWAGFDERKARHEPRFRYFLPPTHSYDETFQILERELASCQ